MEDLNTKIPLFKKIDKAIFDRLDKFKLTPNYTPIQDFYGSLDEEQQQVAKGLTLITIFTIPVILLSVLWWQNTSLKENLDLRLSIVSKANEILGQNQGIRQVGPEILSPNPIDGESMMTSRLSGLLSGMGVDLSKIQVKEFSSTMISSAIMRSEADFAFRNLSTDELMNIFTNMIQREKFRIQDVSIKRNAETNFLEGQFHAIHMSSVTETEEAE